MHPAASLDGVHPFTYSCLFSSNLNTSALGSLPPLRPPPLAAALTFLPNGLLSDTGHSTRASPTLTALPYPLYLSPVWASLTLCGLRSVCPRTVSCRDRGLDYRAPDASRCSQRHPPQSWCQAHASATISTYCVFIRQAALNIPAVNLIQVMHVCGRQQSVDRRCKNSRAWLPCPGSTACLFSLRSWGDASIYSPHASAVSYSRSWSLSARAPLRQPRLYRCSPSGKGSPFPVSPTRAPGFVSPVCISTVKNILFVL